MMVKKQKKTSPRVIVIGLDGASWNILKPLMEEGVLPTFNKLIKKGAYGYLKSIIPPISIPAWKCYSTGKKPSKLGVYSFLTLNLENKEYKVVGSSDFHSKEIWDYIGDFNLISCVYKLFSTYPAKKIKGCMISDFPLKEGGYSPKELKYEIEKRFGSLWFDIYFTTDREGTYIQVLKELEKDFKVVRYLIDKYNPNFVHLSIPHTDGIQHFFWKDMIDKDPTHGTAIKKAWIEIDKQLELFVEYLRNKFGDNFYLFLMSDHGFCGVNYRFNIGKWLVEKGYLKLTNTGKFYRFIFNNLKNIDWLYFLVEKIIYLSRRIFMQKEIRWGIQFELIKTLSEKIIDFKRSKIIPLEGQILYVNTKAFNNQNEKKEFILKVIKEISEIKDPEGIRIAKRVFDGKELYSDDLAPDIIILPNSTHIYNAPLIKTLWSKPFKNMWSGMHDLYGILMAYGPEIKEKSEIKNANIIDIAPTILHIFDIPIPKDMDGRVLKEIFEKDSELAKKPITYQEVMENEKQKIKHKIKELSLKGKL